MIEPLSTIIAVAICLPAIVMAANRSSWLIDYLFFVVALNRGIRRVVDYNVGEFNPFSFISLTPIVVGGLATLVVLIELNNSDNRFGRRALSFIIPYSLAVSAAFAIGFLNTRFAAIYVLGDYIAPIGLVGFAAIYASREDVIDRWCLSVTLSALIVAVYGLYQFYTIPPWDAFWVTAVGFEGYLGELEPTKMMMFSTMAERGPAGFFLASAFILVVLKPGSLSVFRWPVAAVILYAMLLTYSRTSIIMVALACILYPILNRGSGLVPIAVICLLAAFFGESVLARLPGADNAASRVATLSSMQDDGSFTGRLKIFNATLGASMSQPLGLGIGSHGNVGRIVTEKSGGSGDSTGYVETLRTFGWIGFIVIVLVLVRLWKASADLVALDFSDSNVALFRAWFAAGMVAMFSGAWIYGATFFWVFAGYCLGRCDLVTFGSQWCDDEDYESSAGESYDGYGEAFDQWELESPS